MVHYYVRTKVLIKEYCVCGRYVIDIEHGKKAIQAQKEKRWRNVDTRDDESKAN